MKKLNYIVFFSMIAMLIGCNANEWEAPSEEPNHHVVYTSEADYDNKVEVGGKISFGDVSRGVTSRTWTIPSGAIMDGSTSSTSSEDVIHVTFNEVGEHKVELAQTFGSSVYVDTVLMGSQIDTAYTVTVLEPVDVSLKAYVIDIDGTETELDLTSGVTNEILAGLYVKYVFDSKGSPENVNYEFEGGDPATMVYDETQILEGTAAETFVQYKRLGEFSTSVVASRDRPFGADTLSLLNLIKVVPSTHPVELTGVYTVGEKVALDFSREINPETVEAATFTIHLVNTDKGIDKSVAVTSASLDADAANIVLLELEDEVIYYDDVATVTYTPGNLTSLDGKEVDAFSDQLISIGGLVNILESSTFDQGIENSLNSNYAAAGWGGSWDNYTAEVTSEKAYSGSKSLKIHMADASANMAMVHVDDSGSGHEVPTEAGKTYLITAMIYIDNYTAWAGFEVDFNATWTNRAELSGGSPQNEWYEASFGIYTCRDGESKVPTLRAFNEYGGGVPLTYYVDDFSIVEVSLRP
ncbi:hypothetical protein [Flammeovirga agarivorans]|uniref:Uncharacterized protein n=1 Tax=Flammeovirga agarivorans TaxID=2726742 RepID=A0A7X8SQ20_9BACT|nr:hypothetical protein [Flammeovirga agarivorans]NLR94299.1 hypothetical protein [Flammeovirga agarivorans]